MTNCPSKQPVPCVEVPANAPPSTGSSFNPEVFLTTQSQMTCTPLYQHQKYEISSKVSLGVKSECCDLPFIFLVQFLSSRKYLCMERVEQGSYASFQIYSFLVTNLMIMKREWKLQEKSQDQILLSFRLETKHSPWPSYSFQLAFFLPIPLQVRA